MNDLTPMAGQLSETDGDFRVRMEKHIVKISTNLDHLVDYNKQQDRGLAAHMEKVDGTIDSIRKDVDRNKTFVSRCMGVLIALVFLVPAVEAWLVYQNMNLSPHSMEEISVSS